MPDAIQPVAFDALREVHDVLGGMLTSAKLDLSRSVCRTAAQPELHGIATDQVALLQHRLWCRVDPSDPRPARPAGQRRKRVAGRRRTRGIDIGARNGRGTLAAFRVKRARLPGIMLSIYVETQYAKLALRSRANAYLSRHTPRRVAARDPPGGARRRLRRSGASSRRSRANP